MCCKIQGFVSLDKGHFKRLMPPVKVISEEVERSLAIYSTNRCHKRPGCRKTGKEYVISLKLRLRNSFVQSCMISPNPTACFLFLMRVVQLSLSQPFILFHSSLSYSTFGQVLWHNFLTPFLDLTSFLCIHKVSMVT